MLEGLTQRGSVVLAVEDIHWADSASVELLTIVMELTHRLPLMLLVTCRPETAGEAWTFRFHAERNYPHRLTEVRLGALVPEAGQQLAEGLLSVSELPESVRTQIVERAGGNPLFLEEIIRGLAEQGVLRREGETWVAASDVDRWTIPGTLRGVLAARIDALPAEAKRALQRAAVVGRFFTHRAVRAVSEGDEDLERALAQLLRADLIRESGRDPERRYMFKHALVQDAAYVSILGERRKELHAAFAHHLETTAGEAGDEHAAVLAHHWREAEDWERALHHTLRAATRARALYARPEAVALHWQALELLARLPATDARSSTYVELVIELMTLPGWAGNGERHSEGARHLSEAGRIAAEAGDEATLARVEAFQGMMQRDEGLFVRAIERARRIGHHGAEAFALFHYLTFLGQIGRYAEALGDVGHLIETYGAEGETFQQALTMTGVGRCWAARAGHLDESLAYARRFRMIADEQGDARLRAWRVMEGEPYFYLGLRNEVLSVTGESLPIAWEIGEQTPIVFGSSFRSIAALKLGRLDEARRVLNRALTFAKDGAEGRRLIVRARDIFRRIGAVGWLAEADAATAPH